ncbi:uncharacterized protein LOC112595155 [Melanaphis sacchari]|uniref:Wee1-like protein kinase n=1 Tax=Melanaphis sacchari TaxID=742174 RepID=A0A2H8TGV6_9HEMI|nr:uncharacterized protein LOC112595155 [Melanaphis sacchari]
MDKYVKRIKRKEDGSFDDTDKFYMPGGQCLVADDDGDGDLASVLQPAAPQKTEQSDSPPSPISSVSPASADLSKKTIGKMKRNYVSRRLLFDDGEKTSVEESVNEQMVINSRSIKGSKEKTVPEVNPYQTIIDSLSARGFVVNDNYSHCKNGSSPGQCLLAVLDPQTTGTESEDSGILTSSSSSSPPPVFRQFTCLSVFEGISYSVRVADAGPAADESINTAKVLAIIGPHPYIVSYFCNWSDARYHYIQTELCQASLSSLRMNCVADCQTVLEHVSCALHYLHDGKMYAHNRVTRPNVFTAMDGDRVVYKLGGFDGATKLTTTDGSAGAADVQSLCLMVSELIKDGDVRWSADEDDDLRQYLSSVTQQTGFPASASALSVWRWCCSARPPLQRTRQPSMSAMMYRTVGTGGGEGEARAAAAGQAAVATALSFGKTAARRAPYGVAEAAASTSK